ncbi:MAG: pilin [Patescibacteria group bacterium]|jgi:hypothetical protein
MDKKISFKYFFRFSGVCLLTFFFCLLSFMPSTVYAVTTTYSVPQLNVPIPGLDFRDHPIFVDGSAIIIPFFAVYIQAFFKVIIGVGLIATAIMFVWGGMLYVYGATGLQTADAKKKMIDAVIGLVIILGSYVILANINPQTTTLGNLEIPVVQSQTFLIQEMNNNTTNSTMSPDIPPDPEIETVNPLVSGKCTSLMAIDKTKLDAFILSQITGGDYASRINQVAQLLSECKINLGSCNMVTNRAMALAGVGTTDCLLNPKKTPKSNGGYSVDFCWSKASMFQPYTTSFPVKINIAPSDYYGLLCSAGNDCLKKAANTSNSDTTRRNYESYFKSSAVCKQSATEAVNAVRGIIEGKNPGYPKNVTDALQPGDWLITYTANSECDGKHSSVFLGWVDGQPGKARIFTGDIKHKPNVRIDCLDRRCGRYSPIVDVVRPDPAQIRSTQ